MMDAIIAKNISAKRFFYRVYNKKRYSFSSPCIHFLYAFVPSTFLIIPSFAMKCKLCYNAVRHFFKEGGFPMSPKQTFYEHQANTIIANLKKRQMGWFLIVLPARMCRQKSNGACIHRRQCKFWWLHDTFRIRYHGCVKCP